MKFCRGIRWLLCFFVDDEDVEVAVVSAAAHVLVAIPAEARMQLGVVDVVDVAEALSELGTAVATAGVKKEALGHVKFAMLLAAVVEGGCKAGGRAELLFGDQLEHGWVAFVEAQVLEELGHTLGTGFGALAPNLIEEGACGGCVDTTFLQCLIEA